MVTPLERQQVDRVIALLRDALGDSLLGVYLYGSAVAGGLRTLSDLDIMAVTSRRTTESERDAIVGELLARSGPYPPQGPQRPLEVTILARPDLVPWRYPPRTDFQYGEWLREDFERGVPVPWNEMNPDAATLVTTVRRSSHPLFGPPATELLDPVPREDLVRTMMDTIPALRADLAWDTRNVLLTFARMWYTVVTGEVVSKESAATWSAGRLAKPLDQPLLRARSNYTDGVAGAWDGAALESARRTVDAIVIEIRRAGVSS